MGPLWVAKTSILSSQKERGKPVESLGARGRSPRPTPLTVTPSSRYLKCLSRKRGSCKKEEELGALVLDRAGEGGCWGRLGLSWG